MAQDLTQLALHPNRFYLILVVMDFFYPLIAYIQKRALGAYPAQRYRMKWFSSAVIFIHLFCGIIVIYSGVAYVLMESVDGAAVLNDGSQDAVYQLVGWVGLVQAVSILYLLPMVRGEKAITQSLYFLMCVVNSCDSLTLIRFPSLNNMKLLYSAMNAFIFVRLFMSTLIMWPWIDQNLLYTFSVAAAALAPSLGGHDPVWFCGFILPVFYAPIMAWLGYGRNPAEIFKNTVVHGKIESEIALNMAINSANPAFVALSEESEADDTSPSKRRRKLPAVPGSVDYLEGDSARGALNNIMPSGSDQDLEAGLNRAKDRDIARLAHQSVSPRNVESWGPHGITDTKGAWRNFFMSDKVEAHEITANTSNRSLLLGGVLVAIIVTVIQTQACVNCDPYPGIKLAADLAKGNNPFPSEALFPDFLSIPVGDDLSDNPITREVAQSRSTEVSIAKTGYEWKPRLLYPWPAGEKPQPVYGGHGGPIGDLDAGRGAMYFRGNFGGFSEMVIKPELTLTMQEVARRRRPFVKLPSDYEELVFIEDGFPKPEGIGTSATHDEVIGWEQVTSTSENIRRVETLEDTRFRDFPSESVREVLPSGSSLDSLMKDGNLYHTSYDYIDEMQSEAYHSSPLLFGRNNVTGGYIESGVGPYRKYAFSSTALFSKIDGRLMPIAIWVGGDADLIFTPRDSEADWMFAKMAFTHVNKLATQVNHLITCHMLLEPIVFAAKRTLSRVHPIRVFIEHHGRFSAGLVQFVYDLPDPQNATDAREILSMNGTTLQRMASRTFSEYNFQAFEPETDWAIRGLEDLPNYWFRDDSREILASLDKLTKALVDTFYKTDIDVSSDKELNEWAREVSHPNQGNVREFPSGLASKEVLSKLLSRFAWQSAAYHHAVSGDTAYDVMSHPLDFPSAFYGPAPSCKGNLTLDQLIPTIEQEIYKIGFFRLARRPFPPSDSFAYSYLSIGLGTQMETAILQFTAEMLQLSQKISKRLDEHVASGAYGRPYGLDPARFPYWQWG